MKLSEASLENMMAAWIAEGGPWEPTTLFFGVFTAIEDNGVNTVLGDITQATGAMATRIQGDAWGANAKLANGTLYRTLTPNLTFSPANSGEAQILTGWFVASLGVGGTLLGYGYFPEPIEMLDAFSDLEMVFRLTIDPAGKFSDEVVITG